MHLIYLYIITCLYRDTSDITRALAGCKRLISRIAVRVRMIPYRFRITSYETSPRCTEKTRRTDFLARNYVQQSLLSASIRLSTREQHIAADKSVGYHFPPLSLPLHGDYTTNDNREVARSSQIEAIGRRRSFMLTSRV